MKKATTGVLLWILLTSVLSAAQEKPAAEVEKGFYPHNIGAGAGFATGNGLSYRHWFPSKFGFQITMAPLYSKNEQWVSAGLSVLRIFKQARFVNLFGYAGIHGLYRYNEFEDEKTEETKTEEIKTVYLGAGPGIDIHFWHLSLNIMFGYAGLVELPDDLGAQFSAETALYYSF